MDDLIVSVTQGFTTLKVSDVYKQKALENIKTWLTDPNYHEYLPQLHHLITAKHWDYLLDCFYQVIPFGTGGRRGEVGIGPNRINPWTIKASAQGHSQYLKKTFADQATERGVVLAYDTRQFFGNPYFNSDLPNPVKDITSKDFAISAAEVYAANGIKTYVFSEARTTPELSFAIRHLHCVGGAMFSASHNPPEHNGKKVYDQYGGQLIPPDDEALVNEVTQNVSAVKSIDFQEGLTSSTIQMIDTDVDVAYWNTVTAVSRSSSRSIKIAFTPLHGVGNTSVLPVLKQLGFDIAEDPKTGNHSGKFENVTFNIPNPEVIQSFDTTLIFANEIGADLIINTDPDADRIGTMVRVKDGTWKFINGNEIAILLTDYIIRKRKDEVGSRGTVVKTEVTTSLLEKITTTHGMRIIGDLLVGFKYVGQIMNQMDHDGTIDSLLIGCEESHGYIAGNYVRDKDAAVAAIWLAELASELKDQEKDLVEHLDQLYAEYGYAKNYLTEVRLPGAEGMSQIQTIQDYLRSTSIPSFGQFRVEAKVDWLDRTPIVSDTDQTSKNGLVFRLQSPLPEIESAKITIRPSGTEPKIKMYFEIITSPVALADLPKRKTMVNQLMVELEQAFMKVAYKAIGIDFPERGFLLFWQMPLKDKLKYFEVEADIEALAQEPDVTERQRKLAMLLTFVGSDPIKKVNDAFKAKHHRSIEDFLNL